MHETSKVNPRPNRLQISFCPPGFTLVELLVVIGIIALLIGILLPSLSKAQRIAKRTACMAKLHEIMIGAQMHLQDHHGFYPLVGLMPGVQPPDLDDPYMQKYDYFSYPFPERPPNLKRMIAPITISLATELSAKEAQFVLSNAAVGNAETDDNGFIRNFLCPAQAVSTSEFTQLPMLYWVVPASTLDPLPVYYTESQSYIFNEAVLGWADSTGLADFANHRLKGQFSQIHQPSRTMFAADGLMGSLYDPRIGYPVTGMMTLYNKVATAPVTVWDAFLSGSLAGDTENFDVHRHDKKINIAFCDCHVETRNITGSDLSGVFLMAP